MPVPPSISRCTITVGSSINFFGDDLSISVVVTPLLGTAPYLVWAATGQEFSPQAKTFTGDIAQEVAFQVPHVNQNGFVDPSQASIKNWAYRCVVTIKDTSGNTVTTFTKNVSPVVGQDLIDLDAVPDGLPTTPTTAIIPPVLSVNGQTGNVIVSGGGGGSGSLVGASFVTVDSFQTGTLTDDQLLAAATTYAKAQTYKPTIQFANRQYTFANTYNVDYNGFRWEGDCRMATEFKVTNYIQCPAGGLLRFNSTNKDIGIHGLSFNGTGVWSVTDTNAILTDAHIFDCGWTGFNSVMNCKILRFGIGRSYINGVTDTAFTVGGSDSKLWCEGPNFCSGQINSGDPYIQFGSLSQTDVGNIYITPTKGRAFHSTAGVDATGFIWNNFLATAFGQSDPLTAPTGAAIKLTGGTNMKFLGGRLFNMNVRKDDKAWIVCQGAGSGHVFENFEFILAHAGFTSPDNDANTRAIYTTVPITVINPQSTGGFPKKIKQANPGLVTLLNAPGWVVDTE